MKLFILIILLIFLSGCENKENPKVEKTLKNFNIIAFDTPTLVEKETVIGEAVTKIKDTGINRVSNINLACSAINQCELKKGEEFSFNNLTGERSSRRGYKYAPIIFKGEKSYGIGGGICQVSSTVYMAAVNAGMKITEHYPHSEKVAYAPSGKDATVVYGEKDLKFINNTKNTVVIYAWVEEQKVFSKIIKKSIDIQK